MISILLVLVLLLAACGGDDEDEPTAPAPSQSGNPNATATVGTTQPSPGATTPGSPGATTGEPTIGMLADRIAAAWTGVTTYRLNEVTFPAGITAPPVATPDGTPIAGAATAMAIDVVVFPDRTRRQIVENGVVVSEILVADARIFLRGEIVSQYVDASIGPDTWVSIDIASLGADTPLGQIVIGFLGSTVAPLGLVPADQRTLPVRPAGQTSVNGRTCDVYETTQTTVTGEPIDVAIGLDATGLPCSIETRAGGLVTLATYVAFNEPITIEAPADFETRSVAATPVADSTPVAGEPTPGG